MKIYFCLIFIDLNFKILTGKFSWVIALVILLNFISCSSKSDQGDEFAACFEKDKRFEGDHSYIFLIPTYGCSGCKTDIINLLTSARDNLTVYGILLGEWNKSFQIEFEGALKHKGIYYDSTGCFSANFNSLYPILIELRGNKIVSKREINSENLHSELERIKMIL
jgi:hypothetical protein